MKDRKVYLTPDKLGMTEEEDMEKKLVGLQKTRAEWEHFTPEFVGTHTQEVNLAEVQEHLETGRRIYVDGRLTQNEAEVRIHSAWPIAIAFLGDLHIGSVFSNVKEIFRKKKIIEETPGMYAVFMGNLVDNAIPAQFPSNMLYNTINPDKQIVVTRKILEELNEQGKVIGAVTSPCHEGWSAKHAGQDVNALLHGFEGRNYPVLENGGRLHVVVGEQEYVGALYHQVGPFNSHFNETHPLKQLNRLTQNQEMDFLAAGHHHVGEVDMTYEGVGEHRKQVAFIRTGSEKGTDDIHDKWAIDKYGVTGEPTGQVLHLSADEKRMSVDLDFDQGVENHEGRTLLSMFKKRKEAQRAKRTTKRSKPASS
jgi:hypothetical protein